MCPDTFQEARAGVRALPDAGAGGMQAARVRPRPLAAEAPGRQAVAMATCPTAVVRLGKSFVMISMKFVCVWGGHARGRRAGGGALLFPGSPPAPRRGGFGGAPNEMHWGRARVGLRPAHGSQVPGAVQTRVLSL